jgi:hypothetical protein
MTLGELIALLETLPRDRVCVHAFTNPHSWRGVYAELAFEPADNRTIGEMLSAARSAVGTTYQGYKGGYYTMSEWTSVHIERYGTGEDLLPEYGIQWMLGEQR